MEHVKTGGETQTEKIRTIGVPEARCDALTAYGQFTMMVRSNEPRGYLETAIRYAVEQHIGNKMGISSLSAHVEVELGTAEQHGVYPSIRIRWGVHVAGANLGTIRLAE